jgi:hypothetical protein
MSGEFENFEVLDAEIKKRYNNLNHSYNSYLRNGNFNCTVERILRGNGLELEFLENQTKELCKIAVNQNIYSFVFIKDKNIKMELLENLLEKNGMLLQFIKNKTSNLCEAALKNDVMALQYIDENPENYYEFAINSNPMALEFIKNKTKELCTMAVRRNGMVLQFLDKNEQTEDIIMQAFRQNPKSFEFVKNKSNDIISKILDSVKKYNLNENEVSNIIKYVDDFDMEIYKKIISMNPSTLHYIKNQNEEIVLFAIDALNNNNNDNKNDKKEKYLYDLQREKNDDDKYTNNDTINKYDKLLKERAHDDKSFYKSFAPEYKTKIAYHIKYWNANILKKILESGNDDLSLYRITNDILKNWNFSKEEKKEIFILKAKQITFANKNYKEYEELKNYWKSHINSDLDELYTIMIGNNGFFEILENPSEKLCILALEKNHKNLKFIKNQTEEMCKKAIENEPMLLEFVINQNDNLCMYAVTKNPEAIRFVINQNDNLCMYAVTKNPEAIRFVKNKSRDICDLVINKYLDDIASEKNKEELNKEELNKEKEKDIFEEVDIINDDDKEDEDEKDDKKHKINCRCYKCLSSIKSLNFYALGHKLISPKFLYVEHALCNASPEKIEEVLKYDGLLLKHVSKQTLKMCENAVQQNGLALEFAKIKNDEICEMAVKNNHKALLYVDLVTEKILEIYEENKSKNNIFDSYKFDFNSIDSGIAHASI